MQRYTMILFGKISYHFFPKLIYNYNTMIITIQTEYIL